MVNLGLFPGSKTSNSVILSFRIPYYTHWGQHLLVCGSESVLGSWNVKKGLLLRPSHQGDELIWSGSLSVPAEFNCEYSYYVVDDDKNVLRWEAGKKRNLLLPNGVQNGQLVELHDLWQTGSDDLPLRSAFKNVIFRKSWNPEVDRPLVSVRSVLDHEELILGKFIFAHKCDKQIQSTCNSEFAPQILKKTHQYCKYSKAKNLALETGGNRELSVDFSTSQPKYIVLSDGLMREMPWRGAGVAIPMFSIRSDADMGVGEFLDLKLLVDWAVESGFHLVQLLPINDTSVHGMWWDSYPYSSLSVFALHPLYLRVQALSENISKDIMEEIQRTRKQLDGKNVDYEASMAAKLSIAKKIYSQEKENVFSSVAFQNFFSENQLEKLVSKESLHYDIICFHYYIQFHLHMQLSEAASYAREKGVVLKGDLPIGVDRNSVDTWVFPNLFRMNTSTGAPPDYFDKNGQNWGFPTYNWEEMSKDNYAWWRGRLTQMAKYFTAYRIDHILGFFRIWELPDHALTGLCGKFRPSIPLSQEELEREGIWDFNRLSQPYIRQQHLQEKFGASWTIIASNFLDEFQKDHYQFKEDCDTEKKIASKLKSCLEKSIVLESEEKIRRNLFDLIQASEIWENVVLIKDREDSKKFYPRFNLEDTSSFSDLDEHSKNVLKRLYYDYYFQRQETLWRQNALKTLPVLLNSSDMLACGEDLGLIPSCVHPVMQELGLIGLRIQRMPSEPGLEFGIPSQYSYMTVRCIPEIVEFVLRQHVEAPSMWAIFPLQDLLALKDKYTTRPAAEETINDPTNPKHYWRYRVHVTVESLLEDKELISSINGLVHGSGRSCPPSQGDELRLGKSSKDSVKQPAGTGEAHVASQLNGIPRKEEAATVA
ncbi:UNVERIFIED_CONTAM: 4-alpha-glucanotransferase DPE2 [Sesamum radiatum]|uniref:4-alpha-glucanotransferase n=1 Tax=Sesamum radiatum TaxID=300843 RepID=A0AAW2LDA7_SESRA